MTEFQKPNLLIVVPCFNEQSRLDLAYWKKIILSNPSAKFIFVDDGSTDNTLEKIRDIGQESNVISLKKNSGKSEAIRQGWLQFVHESPWAGCGFIDSDGAFSPDDIQKIINIFEFHVKSSSKVDAILSARVALAGRKIGITWDELSQPIYVIIGQTLHMTRNAATRYSIAMLLFSSQYKRLSKLDGFSILNCLLG